MGFNSHIRLFHSYWHAVGKYRENTVLKDKRFLSLFFVFAHLYAIVCIFSPPSLSAKTQLCYVLRHAKSDFTVRPRRKKRRFFGAVIYQVLMQVGLFQWTFTLKNW